MKAFGLINIGILPLLLEAMVPVYAQGEPREQEPRRPPQGQEAHPGKQPPAPGRPEGREPHQRPQNPQERPPDHPRERPQAPPGRPQAGPPARPANPAPQAQEPRRMPPQAGGRPQGQPPPAGHRRPLQLGRPEFEAQHRGVWQEHRAPNGFSDRRTWAERGGYGGYRIPGTRFRGHFGPGHSFRMAGFPLRVVDGFPRFQFGGFWFSVVDPWPMDWSGDWYTRDELYVDFSGGGYYLRNLRHPMDRVAVMVFVN